MPQDGLTGKSVWSLATGGSIAHLLALDYALRPVLAALGARSHIDPVYATDTPLEAAGADLVYVAHQPPAPQAEALVVFKGSAIKTVADLKGKRIAMNKGSNVHHLLVKALEKAIVQAIIDEQQKIADAFFALKLIPKPLRISDELPQALRTAAK